jgi:hypothetical protein
MDKTGARNKAIASTDGNGHNQDDWVVSKGAEEVSDEGELKGEVSSGEADVLDTDGDESCLPGNPTDPLDGADECALTFNAPHDQAN